MNRFEALRIKKHARDNKIRVDPSYIQALLRIQDFRCRICGLDLRGMKKAPHLDHNHVTGRIRGLLCLHCNIGLGHFKDRPELLLKAAAYLVSPPPDVVVESPKVESKYKPPWNP